ncbi:cytochrome o ubiquinol oxidase, subunit III [mine drainage metagenome]|uniref:Cytochrome bo(3) ubiquinol oxidase subunit 3 n=2 Tax=root TaxID=1 RepID=A0A9E6SXJ1_9PROT|nr:cytochrome o ubiquinol oxidase subunit III [Ferrovum myxofaciens]QKE39461.1 MAG: cytochrome o ubiquinol oxidase subunit III [Ferrovum myxofaciens]QKE42078.1 MAG: cytochrome o ubiquinol oxidase subunit III [Ferrovum myxofaciens]QWY74738.1 MAG: cytochrome o ubiquinol oxidase subunit III [Ferrovum myxofaciens]QWY77484.1 MAG: cytochrome o ubiquinol oxidase subunit III [Ferrovum myxofaciens]
MITAQPPLVIGNIEREHPEHDSVGLATFGFWLYLMTDCVLFAALFATYAVLHQNFAGGPTGKDLFDIPYVFVETLCLLLSSTTAGFALLSMQRQDRTRLLYWLGLTVLLGMGFIGMEIHEFIRLMSAGNGPQRSGFLSAFFTLVGTHGLHVTIGLLWMINMILQIRRRGITVPIQSRLIRLSLFWHFLDLIWIGVFTLVYLMGVSS